MSLSNLVLKKDPTISVTSGTDVSVKPISNAGSELKTYLDGDTYVNRSVINFSTKAPKPSTTSPSNYTQARSEVYLAVPFEVTSNGIRQTTLNTVKIAFSTDVNTTPEAKATLLKYAAQLLANPNLSEFWNAQSLV